MQRFDVDDDLVELVWTMAKPKPFETLTFSVALRRALTEVGAPVQASTSAPKVTLDELVARAKAAAAAMPKKAPSPSVSDWVSSVPDLKGRRGLSNWKAVCDYVGVDPAGDSARRKLKAWVALNRPAWPSVPEA